MKRFSILLAVIAGLVACGGDTPSTRDNIVRGLRDSGTDIDQQCVNSVLDGYTDDELDAIDQNITDSVPSPEEDQLLQQLLACVPATT